MHAQIKTLLSEFPEWGKTFSETNDPVWPYQVSSINGNTRLKFSYYDRLVVKFERESLGFWSAPEAFETLRNIVKEKLVVIEYILDRELAKKLCQDVPGNIPNYIGGAICEANKIPNENNEWYFANTIRVISWLGTYNSQMEAVFGNNKSLTRQ